MDVRERSTQSTETGGYWFRTSEPPGTQHPRAVVNAFGKHILDYTNKEVRKKPDLLAGFLPPSDLELREDWFVAPRMARSGTGLNLVYAAVDYGGDLNIRSSLYKIRGSLARQQENDLYSVLTLARSNPFRTDYSIPVAIKELLDVSSMFKLVGRTLASFVGGSYLNIKFGWEQFLRDLANIERTVKLITSRVKEFESLNKHGGLRRKVWLDTLSLTESNPNKIIQSTLGITGRAATDLTATMKVYGSVRWVPKRSFRDVLDDVDKTSLAIQTLFGLGGVDSTQLWNMIPFTWVIDYFFAVSEFLQVLSGQDYIEPRDLCIMREYRHTEKISPTTGWTSPLQVSKGKTKVLIKARDVWVPTNIPPFQVRLLSGTQLTNLGALIATLSARMK